MIRIVRLATLSEQTSASWDKLAKELHVPGKPL